MKKLIWLIASILIILGGVSLVYISKENTKAVTISRMFYVYTELNKLDAGAVKGEVGSLGSSWKTLSTDEYKKLLNDQHIYDDKLVYDFWKRPYVARVRVGDKQALEWILISSGPSGVIGSPDNYRLEDYKMTHP